MKDKLIKYLIIALSSLVVIYPLSVAVRHRVWAWDGTLLTNVFPLLGLTAFTILWLHIVGPAVEPWIEKFVNFRRFLDRSSPFILVFMLLHPVLLLWILKFKIGSVFDWDPYIQLGAIGLVFLLTFDIGTFLKKRSFVQRHWEKILLISTIGFIFIFFHSLNVGHDLEGGPLRTLWIFLGTTAILAAIYNYGVKKFLRS